MENKQKPSLTGMTKNVTKVANKNQITFIEYQLIHGPAFHGAKYFINFATVICRVFWDSEQSYTIWERGLLFTVVIKILVSIKSL